MSVDIRYLDILHVTFSDYTSPSDVLLYKDSLDSIESEFEPLRSDSHKNTYQIVKASICVFSDLLKLIYVESDIEKRILSDNLVHRYYSVDDSYLEDPVSYRNRILMQQEYISVRDHSNYIFLASDIIEGLRQTEGKELIHRGYFVLIDYVSAIVDKFTSSPIDFSKYESIIKLDEYVLLRIHTDYYEGLIEIFIEFV